MVERLPEISKQPQSLEESLRARRDFVSLPQGVKSFIGKIDKLENPPLTRSKKELALILGLWMSNPLPKDIAALLGREAEEIEEQINQAIKGPEDQELIEAISRLTKDGEFKISWGKPKPRSLTPEFKKNVKELRREGVDNEAIAEILDVTPNHLQYAISFLIKNGEIKSRNRTRPTPR